MVVKNKAKSKPSAIMPSYHHDWPSWDSQLLAGAKLERIKIGDQRPLDWLRQIVCIPMRMPKM